MSSPTYPPPVYSPAPLDDIALTPQESAYSKQDYAPLPSIKESRRSSFIPLAFPSPPTLAQHHSQPLSPSYAAPDLLLPPPSPRPYTPPSPSLKLLFSPASRRDLLLVLLPAALVSIAAGVIAPFMTQVVGHAFDVFVAYPTLTPATSEDKIRLLRGVGKQSLILIGLAAASLASATAMYSLWIIVGETIARRVRVKVYEAVARREMAWFDLGMGKNALGGGQEEKKGGSEDAPKENEASLGAGGLMARFTRETDDIRVATSYVCGLFLQNITTAIVCAILSFIKSWSLTLVLLASLPLIVSIQAMTSRFSNPLLARERAYTAEASTRLTRAVNAISTVKAFNAAEREVAGVAQSLEGTRRAATAWAIVWGAGNGAISFVVFALFVQGFWYGSRLVRRGELSAGDVMTVFWATMLAATHLQQCMSLFVNINKGKTAMTSLQTLINPPPAPSAPSAAAAAAADDDDSAPLSPTSSTPTYPASSLPPRALRLGASARPLRKIRPSGPCHGEFMLRNVTFAYPSRPTVPALRDVSLFLPAGETTYIVGGSGSGKSTVAQLLLRLYEPQAGSIELDDQSFAHLDPDYTRAHIAAVSQDVILFPVSVHDNVALGLAGCADGRTPARASREEVVAACRTALMHDFVRDLPDGYETILGNGGADLSGGQKQRLAIARARLRDPDVLILDEATSALDATSRLLIHEAVKTWRKNKTTIVITHDVAQVSADDFVYHMKHGQVVDQGFRADLELNPAGEFRALVNANARRAAPAIYVNNVAAPKHDGELEMQEVLYYDAEPMMIQQLEPPSPSPTRPISSYLDILTSYHRQSLQGLPVPSGRTKPSYLRRQSAWQVLNTSFLGAQPDSPSPTRQSFGGFPSRQSRRLSARPPLPVGPSESEERLVLEKAGDAVLAQRRLGLTTRRKWLPAELEDVKVQRDDEKDGGAAGPNEYAAADARRCDSAVQVLRNNWRDIPYKPVFFLGILTALVHGATTPVFSYFFSKVLSLLASPTSTASDFTFYSLLVLLIAAISGFSTFAQQALLEFVANAWIIRVRTRAARLALAQDKAWFDERENGAAALVQLIVKDSEDARLLISHCIGTLTVVVTMILLGIVWALVVGWQLTLVGIALAPVFLVVMGAQAAAVGKWEGRIKRKREAISRAFYEMVSNIRGIRAMALERVFLDKFQQGAKSARRTGVRSAPIYGIGFGAVTTLVYLAQALMFYIGAMFIIKGIFNYPKMLEVFSIVMFSITMGSQALASIPAISKACQGATDVKRLLQLPTETSELHGTRRYPITGAVNFTNVSFAYPTRPGVTVLKDVSLSLREGECVAVVGGSGSGKSTIAALLQRLYEPSSGEILLDSGSGAQYALGQTDVRWLRNHIAVVSQHSALFDVSVTENITYGSSAPLPHAQIVRAAKAANVHDFILGLPNGYDTVLGENASLISGGQAQRLQIARALARDARMLILDECTSALDAENARAVMDTVMAVKEGRTTVVVTHKLPDMQMCDRIIVVQDGRIVEQGDYESLMASRGSFFTLASGGEWSS